MQTKYMHSQVKEELPENGEQDALKAIRNDSRLQTPTEEAKNTIL